MSCLGVSVASASHRLFNYQKQTEPVCTPPRFLIDTNRMGLVILYRFASLLSRSGGSKCELRMHIWWLEFQTQCV